MKKITPQERIALVQRACEKDGHVSRKTLMKMYGISQIEAGLLMRDFIHQNAVDLEWHALHSHYKMTTKSEK